MSPFFALLSGSLFTVGLVISGMVNPKKVIGFLDIFGSWDPSLLFVMVGAIFFNLISFHFLMKKKPLCSECHDLPSSKKVTPKLVIGSALFGIGWGLLGICPGPGLVNLATLELNAFLFILSLLIGMSAFKFFLDK